MNHFCQLRCHTGLKNGKCGHCINMSCFTQELEEAFSGDQWNCINDTQCIDVVTLHPYVQSGWKRRGDDDEDGDNVYHCVHPDRLEDAVQLFTDAVKLNPTSALLYAKRAKCVSSVSLVRFLRTHKYGKDCYNYMIFFKV